MGREGGDCKDLGVLGDKTELEGKGSVWGLGSRYG